jgi:hypothetical protein
MTEEPITIEKLDDGGVKHFSIFLDNKVGALLEVVRLINDRNIVVLALSIQDSAESSICRFIVSDPEEVSALFDDHDIAYNMSHVVVAELKDGALSLGSVLASLLKAEVNLLFSYPMLIRPKGRPLIALHVDDIECSTSVLRGDGFRVLNQSDLSR